VALLPGLDGRKMSKSYDNTIPMFTPREQLRKLIAGLVTDSRTPGEPKVVEGSALFQMYQAFASAEETASMRLAYADGIAWGDAKQTLFERIDRDVAPMRARYEALIQNPAHIEALLLAGARKARDEATPMMDELRRAVGLRSLTTLPAAPVKSKTAKTAAPLFKQYREADGHFYIKLQGADGHLLLQSNGFLSPKDAAQTVAQLQKHNVEPGGSLPDGVTLAPGVSLQSVIAALAFFSEATPTA